jgi:hypothetical protein
MLEVEGGSAVEHLKKELVANKGDIFATLHHFFDWMLDSMTQNKNRDLFRNIMTEMDFRTASHTSFGSENHKGPEFRTFLYEHVDLSKLQLEQKSDLGVLMHFAVGNFLQTLTHYYTAQNTEREITMSDAKRRVHLGLDWLEHGASSEVPVRQD